MGQPLLFKAIIFKNPTDRMKYYLSFIRIKSADDVRFNQAWQLYQKAFPVDERRQLAFQKVILDNDRYHFKVIIVDYEFVGILLLWHLDTYLYLEHFAISEKARGGGIGQMAMKKLMDETDGQIILEVEPPSSTINKRRIGFYERLGFKLNHHEYHQPPLQKAGCSVQLLLMSHPKALAAEDVSLFKKQLNSHCFAPYSGIL